MQEGIRLDREFFARDVLCVAPELVGKIVAHRTPNGVLRLRISETEAYRGEQDTACHAHKGRTRRTDTLYQRPGTVYLYLCYGIHWLLNLVTGEEGQPQAVLLRAALTAPGPGRLTRALGLGGELNGCDATCCPDLWIEDDGARFSLATAPRVGIGYASPEHQALPWRFILDQEEE